MNKCFLVALPQEVGFKSEINGIPVFFSGVGKVNSTIKTYELSQKGIKEIINIGSCGSKKFKIGDILKIGSVYQDIDATPLSEYGITPFNEDSKYIVIDDSSDYSCFSTDYFYDQNQIHKYSENYLNMINSSSCFDMELYGISKVCRLKGITLTSYKWVSDDGNADHWIDNCKIYLDKITDIIF